MPTDRDEQRSAGGAGGPGPRGEGAQVDELLHAVSANAERRSARIGVFVILGIIAVLWTLFTLTDASVFRGRYFVYTVVENAGGIRNGDPVRMRGVNIGRIHGFEMAPSGVGIRLEIEGEYEVPEDSRVALRSGGLLGGMVAEVLPGLSGSAVEHGDSLPGSTIAGPVDMASELGPRADEVLQRIQTLFSGETVGAVERSATELEVLLAELTALANQQRGEMEALTSSLRRSAEGVERVATGESLERTIARIDSLTMTLDAATTSLDAAGRSLAVVLGRLERGEGTLGLLSRDETLYVNMNTAAENLARLAADLQENPGRYVNISLF